MGIFSSIFSKKKKSHIVDEVRDNKNLCYYCDEEIGNQRFSYNKGKHFHKRCVKKFYKNGKRKLKDDKTI